MTAQLRCLPSAMLRVVPAAARPSHRARLRLGSNPRTGVNQKINDHGFRDRRIRPLCHLSVEPDCKVAASVRPAALRGPREGAIISRPSVACPPLPLRAALNAATTRSPQYLHHDKPARITEYAILVKVELVPTNRSRAAFEHRPQAPDRDRTVVAARRPAAYTHRHRG